MADENNNNIGVILDYGDSAGKASAGSTGIPINLGNGQTIHLPVTDTSDTQQLQIMIQAMIGGLTPDEKKELDILQKEWEAECKADKILVFKKLSPEIRQYVVNMVLWNEGLDAISNVNTPKKDRLQELIKKDSSSLFRTMSGASLSVKMDNSYYRFMNLPNDISGDELKRAHSEQSMEEELECEESK